MCKGNGRKGVLCIQGIGSSGRADPRSIGALTVWQRFRTMHVRSDFPFS
jgi:hypothetical protein